MIFINNDVKMLSDDEIESFFSADALESYMKIISKYPTLSVEEQKRLGNIYRQTGDLKAKNILINSNLRLVVSIAYHYRKLVNHMQILDLVQEGNLGLIRSLDSYDPDKSAFTSYATIWIKQAIIRAISIKEAEIRKPSNLFFNLISYNNLIIKCDDESIPLPSDDDICKMLNITPFVLSNLKQAVTNQKGISINQFVLDEEDTLENFIPHYDLNYDNIINKIDDKNLYIVLKEILSPLQYFILYYRVLCEDNKTLEEIANCFKVKRERIRQYESNVLRRVKPYIVTNSHLYVETLAEIKKREGHQFYMLKTKPISPTYIVKYMYLKNNLTDMEKLLYQLCKLSKYEYMNDDYVSILGINKEELQDIILSINNKITTYIVNNSDYEKFREELLEKYKTKVFEIEIDDKKIKSYYK